MIWNIKGKSLFLDHTLLMGILNLTPDSFSDGGDYVDPEKACLHGESMVQEGAAIIDLGAESSRPNAEFVDAHDEVARISPILKKLLSRVSVPISIDTTKPEVAEVCLKLGAHIINDVSGLQYAGKEMANLICEYKAGLVLMHRRGNAQTMQSMTIYNDVVRDVISELEEAIAMALECGVDRQQIVIDPGIGFAKTAEQSLEILQRIEEFKTLGFPILVGASRKSFLGELTGRNVKFRDGVSAAVASFAAMKGVHVLRVHDLATSRDALKVTRALNKLEMIGSRP